MPTRGEAGGAPSGTEAYYSFDYGNIHFICLNSHDLDRSPTGAMVQWLTTDLEEAQADWLIAFWHHPPYTKGTHDSDRETQLIEMRQYIMPILESAGVDLVLTGHSHTYERSMLIDGAYVTPTTVHNVVLDDGDGTPHGDGAYRKSPSLNPHEGSVSVVAGHGRAAIQHYGLSAVMRRTIPVIGSFLVDVNDRLLTGRMIDGFGNVLDEFQIDKRNPVEPTRLTHPWRPSGPSVILTQRSPDSRTLEMFPVPPAPDAIVRYEINGDEVTESSPVYSTPIPLAKTDRFVQAKTYWKNATRTSPPTTTVIPLPSAAAEPELHSLVIPISKSADDAAEDSFGRVSLDATRLFLGNDDQPITGFRFTDVGIPPEATIFSAHVEFHSTLGSYFTSELQLQLEKSANAMAFNPQAPFDLSSRAYYESTITWTPPIWGFSQRTARQKSPNFAQILQAHLSESNWQTGNSLAIAILGTGNRDTWSFDHEPEFAARLHVTFDSRDALAVAIDQPFIVQPVGYTMVDGTIVNGLLIQHRRLAASPPGHFFDYRIEVSTSLKEAEWVSLPDSELVKSYEFTTTTWREITLLLPLSLIGDSPGIYFRTRITARKVAE